MLDGFSCPVCDARDWREVGRVVLRAGERQLPGQPPLTEWEQLRRRILFEVWLPGRNDVVLTLSACRACGFVAYAPRPSALDIGRKYAFLQRHEVNIGGSDRSGRGARLDRRRADRTRRAILRGLGREPRRVLDFGGGDGKLLGPFLERGVECGLLDFNPEPLPGVRRLGETLADLPADEVFDAIICSHVLEHLASPAAALRGLAEHLQPDGVLFSEVPLEIWKGIPIARDPVTHVNFFHRWSLADLHLRHGFELVALESRWASYGASRKPAAVAVAKLADSPEPVAAGHGAAETERLLRPSLADELSHAWGRRRVPSPAGVLRRLGMPRGSGGDS